MPNRKTTKAAAAAAAALPSIPKELSDQFVKGPMAAEAVQAASWYLGLLLAQTQPKITTDHAQAEPKPRHA